MHMDMDMDMDMCNMCMCATMHSCVWGGCMGTRVCPGVATAAHAWICSCCSISVECTYPPAVGVLDLSDEILRLRLCQLERRHQDGVTVGYAGVGATSLDEGLWPMVRVWFGHCFGAHALYGTTGCGVWVGVGVRVGGNPRSRMCMQSQHRAPSSAMRACGRAGIG